jgi:hypothetical protein
MNTPAKTLTSHAVPNRPRGEHSNPLRRMAPVMKVLHLRYPEIPLCVIREQILDVLSMAAPGRAVPALVMRLVDARLWAMS